MTTTTKYISDYFLPLKFTDCMLSYDHHLAGQHWEGNRFSGSSCCDKDCFCPDFSRLNARLNISRLKINLTDLMFIAQGQSCSRMATHLTYMSSRVHYFPPTEWAPVQSLNHQLNWNTAWRLSCTGRETCYLSYLCVGSVWRSYLCVYTEPPRSITYQLLLNREDVLFNQIQNLLDKPFGTTIDQFCEFI